jgi:hypothetical protein
MRAVYEERRDWFTREATEGLGAPLTITVELEQCHSDPERVGSVFGVAEPTQDSTHHPGVAILDDLVDVDEHGVSKLGSTALVYLDRERAGVLLEAISRQWPELL